MAPSTINVAGVEEALPADKSKYEEAFKTAEASMKHAIEVLYAPDFESKTGSWKLECSADGITVHSKDLEAGRYYAGRCIMPLKPKEQIDQVWDHLEEEPSWNENIKEAKRLHQLTPYTDIVRYASNKAMMVDSREFVAARVLRQIDGAWILTGRSISLPDEIPELKGTVRGYLHMGAGRCAPNPADADSCIYDYVVCMDLKGMLFKSVINTVMGKLTMKDISEIRKHTTELKNARK